MQQVFEELKQDVDDVIKILTVYGVTASKDDWLKNIASQHNTSPLVIVNRINELEN